jgi:hypothetical protein
MKKFGIAIFLITSFLTGCNETSTSVYNLHKDTFTKEMTDSMIINVESQGGQIEMKGNLTLDEGKCTITLKTPLPDTIISSDTTFIKDTIYAIDSINLTDTIFSIDSIFNIDTIVSIDTILREYIYNKSFTTPNSFSFDEKYDRRIGKWVFKYKIVKEGDIAPSGNFDFNIIYYN